MIDGLTPEQRAAIETLDADLCVSAGAGSGKTRVLVERFLKLASFPLPSAVDQILALTFTRKAALEMKERIAQRLEEMGRVEERRRLEVGYISTIHTFCERVLRENPFEAGLDPEFTVLDAPQAALLRAQAYEQVLEHAFARPNDPIADLADACYDRRTRDGDGIASLQQNVVSGMEMLASRGWGPAEVAVWAREPLEAFVERSLAFVRAQLDPVLTAFQQGITALSELTLGSGQMEAHRQQLVAARAAIGRSPIDGETQLRLLADLRPLLTGRQTKEMAPQAYAAAREQFEAMKQAYDAIQPWAGAWTAEGERRTQRLARAGIELLARLWERYEALKRERAALDFSDLQRLTRDLMRDAPAVRARLRTRLRSVMVDEFQDTDRLQVEILDLLRGERNFFFVGDAKQSIYRFRNADVQLFLEREQAIRERQAREPAAARRLSLATNFRSRPEILAFVNGWLERLGAGLASSYEPLAPGRAFEAKAIPSIDLLPVTAEGGAEAVRRAEAGAVARRLRELIDGGATLTRGDHRERGRALRPRDCVLLLRSLTPVQLYADALETAGLPAFVVGGRSYYARREIRDVVNLLRTIHYPLEDLAVASALRSPFAGISLDTLTLLALAARSRPEPVPEAPPGLYGAIGPALESQPIEPEDAERLRRFATLIDRLREQADRLGVGRILEIALAETEYAVQVLHRPGGRRALANVRKLQQMASRSAGGGVGEFIERIEALSRIREREGDAPTHAESADVVRLMTVHQAKGLEFPLIVLPDLGHTPPRPQLPLLALDPDHRLVAFHAEKGAPSPLQHARAAAAQSAEAAESLRLLYVALTRAEEHLILAGPRPGRTGSWAGALWPHLPIGESPDGDRTIELFEGQVSALLRSRGG